MSGTAKPVVHYRDGSLLTRPVVGGTVYCQTIDHPDLSNRLDKLVHTSRVVRVGEGGEFETANTLYRPERV